MLFEEVYGEDQCKRCGCTVTARYGEDYTEVCDHCAQEIVIEVGCLYRRLGVLSSHLGGTPLSDAYKESIRACMAKLKEALKIDNSRREA